MSRLCAGVLWVGLAGCPGKDQTTTDSETSGDTDTETTPNTQESGESGESAHSGTITPGDRTIIVAASATCDSDDTLTLFAEANGWTGGGVVFMQETGAAEPQYNESHTILSYEAAPSGKSDKLKVTLETGATPPYIPAVNSVFTCDDQIEAVDAQGVPSIMSYIVLIVDQTNQPSDCMAFGHDPMGLINGEYIGENPPPPFIRDILDLCVVGTTVPNPPVCGNGVVEFGEDCDGADLDGATCDDVDGFVGGLLSCTASCVYETAGCTTASDWLADVRATPDGASLALPVAEVLVTAVRPAIGADPAGFFVQADPTGPALFVSVDPATLSPVPVVGDELSFTVNELATLSGLKHAPAISGLVVHSSGNSVAGLVQDLSASNVVVSGLADVESELVALTATISGPFVGAGAGNSQAPITTVGYPAGDPQLTLRLGNGLISDLQLESGCALSFVGPMWRFDNVAQPGFYDAGSATVTSCPAPTVVSAFALDGTTVQISFSRSLDPATVDVGDFAFDNGLTTVSVDLVIGTEVTLTTSPQAAIPYTVTVSTLNDTLGTAIDPAANTAVFDGFEDFLPQLYITELDADTLDAVGVGGTDELEFIEIWNNTGSVVDFNTEGWYLVGVNGSNDLTYELDGTANPSIRLTGTLPDQGVLLLGNTAVSPAPSITFANNKLQNGQDGLMLVRCDGCTGPTDIPANTDVGTLTATFLSASGATVTKVDAVAYETGDTDDSGLWDKLGVTAQWDENANLLQATESISRVAPSAWSTGAPTPGVR